MKLMKEEKIWLVVVLICYTAFLLPGIPEYGNVSQTLIHGGITIGALCLSIYLGQIWIHSKLKVR